MSFLMPLSFALLSLAAVIILLYMLKLRRKEVTVSSTLLWEQLLRDLQANAPFQRLRYSLLLLLQILTLVFAVTALARPFLSMRAQIGEYTALILDASASMKATDVKPSRFEAAKKEALRLIKDLSMGDQMMLIEASNKPKVLCSFTPDKGILQQKLAEAKVKDTTTNLKEAILLALPLIKAKKNGQIVILSDWATEPLGAFTLTQKGQIGVIKFGERTDNVGIVAMSIRRGLINRQRVEAFVSVRNFSDETRKVTLELYHREPGVASEGAHERLLAVKELTLPPNQGRQWTFLLPPVMGVTSGIIFAKIDVKDDLDADNVAYSFLAPQRTVKMLLVTDGNLYLERALAVQEGVEVFKVTPSDYTDSKGYHVTIFDRWAPPKLPEGGVMLIDCLTKSPGDPVTFIGSVERPAFIWWDQDHEITKYPNLAEVFIMRAEKVQPKYWAKPIAIAQETPLMVAGMWAGRRVLFVGFDFRDTNFYGKVAFPILITAAVNWLSQASHTLESTQARTGSLIELKVPVASGSPRRYKLTIIKPDGTKEVRSVSTQTVYYDGTDQVGVYRAEAKGYRREFAVSLLSRDESNLKPREVKEIFGQAKVKLETSARTNKEIWRWLVVLALALLCIEWYLYHRGI